VRSFILISFFLGAVSLSAQTTGSLEGVVQEKSTGEPLVGVSVCIYPVQGQELLSFAISQANGKFKIKIPATGDSLRIELSYMGFKKELYRIGLPFVKNLTVEMIPETYVLREVRIKAPEMSLSGDTVRYNLSAYMQIHDRSIGDVLRQLPGISVSTGGQIRYQGELISHLYIENKELMGKGYGIAVKNLSAEAFATVEVLENHQPVKMLQNREFSPQAAVNLKLKSAYKSVWMFTADAAIGVWPALWSARLMGAQFAQNWQSMHLYKSNNMGESLALELFSFGRAPGVYLMNSTEEQLFSPANTASPVTQSRSLFNHSHLLATNHLTTVGKNVELRVKANYLYNREESDRSIITAYYLPDASVVRFNEIYHNETKTDQLGLELTLKANAKTYFWEDKIEINGAWNSMQSFLERNFFLHQYFNIPNVQLSNNLSWMKQMGTRVLKFGSEISYRQLPQSLSVSEDNDSDPAVQHIILYDLQASATTEVQQRIGKWNLMFNAGINFGKQNLNSHLTRLNIATTAPLFNDISALTLKPYIEPGLQFNLRRNINITCKLSLGYYHAHIKDDITHTSRFSDQWYVNNSLLINWAISSAWELRGAYRRQTIYDGITQMHTGYIMRNYRHFDIGLVGLPYQLRNDYSLSLTYRDVSGLVAHLRGGYVSGFKNYLTHRELTGFYMFSQLYKARAPSDYLFVASGISKRFADLRLSVGLSLGCNIFFTELVQQNISTHYQNRSWNVSPRIAWSFTTNSKIEYDVMLNSNQLFTKGSIQNPKPLLQWQHNAKTTIAFSSRLYAQLNIEYYANETSPGLFTEGIFGDIGLSLNCKKVKFHLDLKNIFNQDHYTLTSYSDLSSAVYSWKLRPREFVIGASWSF
jgi:hypothetical protein